MKQELPRLLTTAEVEEQTGLSRWTLYKLAKAERIPCVRIGTAVRFSEPAVREWIERGHSGA